MKCPVGARTRFISTLIFAASFMSYLLSAPGAIAQVPVVEAKFSTASAEIPITRWDLLGPFRFNSNELTVPNGQRLLVGLGRDYLLKDFGVREASVNVRSFALLRTGRPGPNLSRRFRDQEISAAPSTNILELASPAHPMDYAVAYVATVIRSPRDQSVVIAVGADDNCWVWLNHNRLFADLNTTAHGIAKFRRLIGGRLRKGNNFLLIKVGNLSAYWQLIVTLYPHDRALQLASDNAVNPILQGSVIPLGQPLRLRGDLLPSSHVQFTVTDAGHAIEFSRSLYLGRKLRENIAGLHQNRLYYCRITVDGQRIERPFYYGDLEAGYTRIAKEATRLSQQDESAAIDVNAQLAHLKYLLQPAVRKSAAWDQSEFWSQRVATSFAELENNIADLGKGASRFEHAAGTHLRGYRSPVDGQVAYYWIHVPSRALASGKPIPLVIVLPYTTGENQPFVDSYLVSAFDETQRYRVLGNEYGFAVLQVWGRGNYLGGTAINAADVFGAFEAVRKDYPVDSNRIYLLGYCEGGRQALLLGERYPDRFAAIAAVAPITIVRARSLYGAKWAQYSSPIAAVAQLRGTPVFISHDVADTPPIEESEFFCSQAQKAGVSVTFVPRHGGMHGFYQNPMAEKRALFKFFVGKQRNKPLVEVSAKSTRPGFDGGRGPIEDAFGGPVLFVEGTTGTAAQRASVLQVSQMLAQEWQKAFFVDCPLKKDVDVTDADVQKYNLVIVGDAGTNRVAKQVAGYLPLQLGPDRISLAGRIYEGRRLGYEFILPNPLNPQKDVVMIGMNQWSVTNNLKLDPWRDGVCDYFILDLQYPLPRIDDAGYFTESVWKKF